MVRSKAMRGGVVGCVYGDMYLLALRSLPQFVDKFSNRHKNRQHQARCQHDEYATQVLDTHGARLASLFIQTAAPTPPLLLQHV